MGLVDDGFRFEKSWVLLNFLVFWGGYVNFKLFECCIFSVYVNCDLWV